MVVGVPQGRAHARQLGSWVLVEALGEGDRESARGVHLAREDLGDRLCTGLPGIPGLHDRVRLVTPRHRGGVAGLQDDDRVWVRGSDGVDHRVLAPGQGEVGQVEALALRADPERDHDIRALGQESCLGRCLPWVEVDVRFGEQLPQLRERRRGHQDQVAGGSQHARAADLDHSGEPGLGRHRARSGATHNAFLGVAADDCDLQLLAGFEREHAVVLQQDDALSRCFERDFVVPCHVDFGCRPPVVGADRKH
jgi:hypothetical protein